jgi:hypothetical protein
MWGEAYNIANNSDGDASSTLWMSDLIRANLDYLLQVWQSRNVAVHGISQQEANKIEKRALSQRAKKSSCCMPMTLL